MFPPPTKLYRTELAILRDFESRVMTARHISSLHFEGRHEAAKKCIQKLKQRLGFIAERTREPIEAAKLQLTRSGLQELRSRGILTAYPPHSLARFAARAQNRAHGSDAIVRSRG